MRPQSLNRVVPLACFAAASALLVHCVLGVPATNPSAGPVAIPDTQPATRSVSEIQHDLQEVNKQVIPILMNRPLLADADRRTAAAPNAIALLKKAQALNIEMGQVTNQSQRMAAVAQSLDVYRVIFGDAEARAALQQTAGGADPVAALRASSQLLQADWIGANKDADAQAKLLDQAATLAKAHPDDDSLTNFLYRPAQSYAANSDLRGRAHALLYTMSSPMFQRIKASELAAAERAKVLHAFENKPLAITGKTNDGKDFTTADWKGKVILVDFWATWCAPCRAELPRVKKAYADFHDKGLEVLGVSNDYSADALQKFLTANPDMPWPQLFNPEAAATQNWNPTTLGFGINGIPTMFLIDKSGVLRTVDARENFEELIPKMLAESGAGSTTQPATAPATQPTARNSGIN